MHIYYRNSETACLQYEDVKKAFKDTSNACRAQGFSFIPMVVEAVGGGWGREARRVWSELAKSSALAAGELTSESQCGASLQQRLSVMLHRENARAVLRRFCPCSPLPPSHCLTVAATLAETTA